MTREFRLSTAGVLFYIILAVNLLVSEIAEKFLLNLSSQSASNNIYQGIISVISLGALLFTSDAIGYLFSSIHIFWWNVVGGIFNQGQSGYSAECQKLSYDLKAYIINEYNQSSEKTKKTWENSKFERQWQSYTAD